jgi:hypothetical protein
VLSTVVGAVDEPEPGDLVARTVVLCGCEQTDEAQIEGRPYDVEKEVDGDEVEADCSGMSEETTSSWPAYTADRRHELKVRRHVLVIGQEERRRRTEMHGDKDGHRKLVLV